MSNDLRKAGPAILVIVLCLLLATFLLHREQFAGKIYSSSDARAAESFRAVGDQCLADGEYPLWNPFVFGGMPSYASAAYTPGVYPLDQAIDRTAKTLGLPPMSWLLVHVFLLGVFTAGYLRWRGQSLTASILAGVWMIAMPNYVAWAAYGHGTKVLTLTWMPLVLWFVEAVLRTGRAGWAFLLAGALGIALRRVHPQIVYYMAIAGLFWLVAYGLPLFRDASTRRLGGIRLGMLAGAGLLALGAAMVIYLPFLEYQGHSIRGAASTGGGVGFDYATGWSLGFSEIATFWWPTAVGFGKASYAGGMPFTDYPNYVGLPILLLAAFALVLRKDRWTIMLASLVVFTTLVALGKNFFAYRVLYELLPGFNKFRVPVMILILTQYALVLLAAAGLDALFGALSKPKEERPAWLGPHLVAIVSTIGVVLVLLGTVGGGFLSQNSMQRWLDMRPGLPLGALEATARMAGADALRLGLVLLACAATAVAFGRRRIPRVAAMITIGVLIFVDLWAVDRHIIHPERALKVPARDSRGVTAVAAVPVVRDLAVAREYVATNELMTWLVEQEARPRIWPLGSLSGENAFSVQGIVSLGGYHAAKLKLYEDLRSLIFSSNPPLRLVNLLSAGWVIAPSELAPQLLDTLRASGMDLEQVYRGSDGVVYRNHSAHPRAWLADTFELEIPGEDTTSQEPSDAVLGRILDPRFDPRRQVILSAIPEPVPEGGGGEGRVRVVEEAYHDLRFEVISDRAAVLVTPDIWYPGWSVTVDGERATLIRADYALRAVPLGPGTHEVAFHFDDSAYRTGKMLSRVSASLIALGLVGSVLWRRRRDPASA